MYSLTQGALIISNSDSFLSAAFFWFVFPLLLSGNGVLLENLTKTGAIGSINIW